MLPTLLGLAECVDELSAAEATAKLGSALSIGTSITKLTLLFSVEGDGVVDTNESGGSGGIFNVETG